MLTLVLRKDLSVAEMTLGGYFEGRQKKSVSKLVIGASEMSFKSNY